MSLDELVAKIQKDQVESEEALKKKREFEHRIARIQKEIDDIDAEKPITINNNIETIEKEHKELLKDLFNTNTLEYMRSICQNRTTSKRKGHVNSMGGEVTLKHFTAQVQDNRRLVFQLDKARDMVEDLVKQVEQWQREAGSDANPAKAYNHLMCVYLPDAIVYLYQIKYGVSQEKAEEMLEDEDVFIKCFNNYLSSLS